MAKISVVDTDQSNVSSITRLLKQKGHTLSFFSTSAALIASLEKKQPDMIIIGVELDGEDGRDLSKLLHMETQYRDIPVILTSPFYHTESEIRSFYCDELVSLPMEASGIGNSVELLLVKGEARALRHPKKLNANQPPVGL